MTKHKIIRKLENGGKSDNTNISLTPEELAKSFIYTTNVPYVAGARSGVINKIATPDPVEEKPKSTSYGVDWLLEGDNINTWNKVLQENDTARMLLYNHGYDINTLDNITKEQLEDPATAEYYNNQMRNIAEYMQTYYGSDYSKSDNNGKGLLGDNTFSIIENLKSSPIYDSTKAEQLLNAAINQSGGQNIDLGNGDVISLSNLIPFHNGIDKNGNYHYTYSYVKDGKRYKGNIYYNPKTKTFGKYDDTDYDSTDDVLNKQTIMSYSSSKDKLNSTFFARKKGIKLRTAKSKSNDK